MAKTEKMKCELQCLECGKKFNKKLGPTSYDEVACPNCGSTDVDLE